MSALGDAAAQVMALAALRDAVAEKLADVKDELASALGAAYKEHGLDGVTAVLSGEEKIGRVSWVVPGQRFRVCDAEAFAEWVASAHPTEVTTVLKVRPVFETVLLKDGLILADGNVVEKSTGECVLGVECFEGASYPRMSFARDGRGAIARAWRDGRLSPTLLELGPAADHSTRSE
jgi:hypothetical protein